MNKDLWEKFKNGEKIAINCVTEDEANEFLKLCEKNNMNWLCGDYATAKNYWGNCKEMTCYVNKFAKDIGIQYSSKTFYGIEGYKIVTYTELMANKKTFTGPELAQAILDGKFKEGTKFKGDIGFEYKLCMYNSSLCLYRDGEMTLNGALIYRTFTLIEEPKLYYFNQVRKMDKKIKIKGWDDFLSLTEALRKLANYYPDGTINEAFNKKVWEVEE
ncbi:hypothetical protein KYB31_09355 [Clostridium felsineum]|uniref:hypothetical protein n=1 Tax=Clostridium felsineum TaxID=36839 RepID=UPI00214D702A|nr:hypothetical protein [Clostridium felsineum]MCR3759195.1 hypothetical protein [Clostridium felsineum]